MAAAHCSTTTFQPFTTTKFCKRSRPIFSSISISTPIRRTKRKNYLRKKLLKTLIKTPYPNTLIPQPSPTNSEITLLPPPEKDPSLPSSDQFPGEPSPAVASEDIKELKSQEFDQSEASESVEVISGNVGNFPKNSALKFGLWLVGAFVFQTVCAVWVFGSAEFDKNNKNLENENEKLHRKNENLENKSVKVNGNNVLEMGFNGNDESRLKLYVNGKVGFEDKGNLYGNEDEMVKKIEEIKVMAREAREKERLERKNNSADGNESDFEDEEDDGSAKSEIEKEVLQRLDKLRKRLEKDQVKFPVGYLKGDGESKGGVDKNSLVDEKKGNEELVFKKKYKFKGSLSEERDRPKGFSGVSDRDDVKIGSSNSGNVVLRSGSNVDGEINKQGLEQDLHEGNVRGTVAMDFDEDSKRKQKPEVSGSLKTMEKKAEDKRRRKRGKRVDVSESKLPKVQDRDCRRPSVETVNSRDRSIAVSNKHDGSLKSRGNGHKQSASTKKRDVETDWWLGLPYVLVILMQQGRDCEGPRGLYTLKGSSSAEGESSHIVAFADRGDATNFSYLLQSFFEDLGDFNIDVVPLSIKELKETIKSQTKKVIVLKKGQLQLYAGQPLADVEMALCALVEQG